MPIFGRKRPLDTGAVRPAATFPLTLADFLPAAKSGPRVSEPLGLYAGASQQLDDLALGLEGLARQGGLPVDKINAAFGMSAGDAAEQHRAWLNAQRRRGVIPGNGGLFLSDLLIPIGQVRPLDQR